MPDALGIAANHRQRDGKDQEKQHLVHPFFRCMPLVQRIAFLFSEIQFRLMKNEINQAAQHSVIGFQADKNADAGRYGKQQPPRQESRLAHLVPAVCVVIAENRHDPQRNKQVREAHRLADGKQLPLAKQGLRAVAERQQRAAEQDHLKAQNNLAYMYAEGRGFAQDNLKPSQ